MESCGKGCGARYPEEKAAGGRHGQAKDASPSISFRSYNAPMANGWTREDAPVANGWAREDAVWAEPSIGASTSANVQQFQ